MQRAIQLLLNVAMCAGMVALPSFAASLFAMLLLLGIGLFDWAMVAGMVLIVATYTVFGLAWVAAILQLMGGSMDAWQMSMESWLSRKGS